MSRHILRALKTRQPILVRNSLQTLQEKEPLSSRENGLLKWYTCGPTVYDDAHLGHARAYVTFDIIRRLIANYTATTVDFALGVTDIDDKIIKRAAESNSTPRELASRFEIRYFEDMSTLNVLEPTRILRVTEHVTEIQALIRRLETACAAYATPGGNVYFSVGSRGERYGLLDSSRGLDVEAAEDAGGKAMREKRDRRDFALWKRTTPADPSDAQWASPWGAGRPGWHVECSAMALHALGDDLDLHTGGIDLRFPHHTNELAAAEAALRVEGAARWAHTWLHAGHLHMRGRKMSKSLKNFVKVRDYLRNGGCPDVFRLFCLAQRYSAPVEWTDERADAASAFLRRVRTFASRDAMAQLRPARSDRGGGGGGGGGGKDMRASCSVGSGIMAAAQRAQTTFEQCVCDDFDTPRLLQAVGTVISSANLALRGGQFVSGAAGLAYAEAKRVVADGL